MLWWRPAKDDNMDDRVAFVRQALWWLPALALLGWIIDWEMRRAAALGEALRDPVVSVARAVEVALLPEYRPAAAGAGAGDTVARPLFNPTRRPAPPAVPESARQEVQRNQFVLVGTTVTPEGSVALLREASGTRSRPVRKGDRINGMLVVDIRPDRVKLAASGQVEDLVLKPATSPNRGLPPLRSASDAQSPLAASLAAQVRPAQVYQTPVPGLPGPPPGAAPPLPNAAAAAPDTQPPVSETDSHGGEEGAEEQN
jgi:hypothetical protein